MAKEKSPAFQFYPKDFLVDENVATMSLQEIGAYVVLLCHAWIERGIPGEPAALARLCRVSTTAFNRIWPRLEPLFCGSDAEPRRLFNRRQEEERAKQEEWRQKSSEGGKRSASVRWPPKRNQSDKGGYEMVISKGQPAGNSPSPSPSPSPNTTFPIPLPSPSFQPDWERFMGEYPGQIKPDRDCQVFLSVIKTQGDEDTLYGNLAAWKESQQWVSGKIESAKNFLWDGQWRVKPVDPNSTTLMVEKLCKRMSIT